MVVGFRHVISWVATCSGCCWKEKDFLISSSWTGSGNGRPSFGVRLGWGFSNGSHGDEEGCVSCSDDEAESTSAFPRHTPSATSGRRIFQGFSRASERQDSHAEQGNHFSFAKAVVSVLPLAECTAQ